MQIADLNSKLEKERKMVNDLTNKNEDLGSKFGKEKKIVKDQAMQIENLNNNLEKEKKTVKELEASNKKQAGEIAVLKQDKESLQSKAQIVMIIDQCKAMEEENKRITEELENEVKKPKFQDEEGLEAENDKQDDEIMAERNDEEPLQSKAQAVTLIEKNYKIAEDLAKPEEKYKVMEEEKKPIPAEPHKAVLPVYTPMPIEKAKENKYYKAVIDCKSKELDLRSIHLFIILGGKEITDDDARAIAVAIKTNTTITKLRLGYLKGSRKRILLNIN
jgi:hypothetical protein